MAGAATPPDTATFAAAGLSVVVERSPVRLTFVNARGETVLRQAQASAVPRGFESTDPELYRLGRKTAAAYGPFIYEVGKSNRSFFFDTIKQARRVGTFHAATAVIDSVQTPDGLSMTLATTEPGRTLRVRIAADDRAPDGLRVFVEAQPSAGVIAIGDSFTSGRDEQFYGFGGRRNRLSQRGRKVLHWTSEPPLGLGIFQPLADLVVGPRYTWPGGEDSTYHPQSLFASSRPYGFFVDHDDAVRFRMAYDRSDAWQFSGDGARTNYSVVPGHGSGAVAQLTKINGRQRVSPEWSQQPILSRTTRFGPLHTRGWYRQAVMNDLAVIERERPDIESYAFECWGNFTIDEVRAIIARLNRVGVRSILYVKAHAGQNDLGLGRNEDYADGLRDGLFTTNAAGAQFTFPAPLNIGDTRYSAGVFDLTNPRGRAWLVDRVNLMLDLGASGFMADFGNEVTDRMKFFDGSVGEKMHHGYITLYLKTVREAVDAWHARNPERDEPFFYSRPGASGRPGSVGYDTANFAGDITSDWAPSAGLPTQPIDMLNRAVGGAWGFTTDIGGFFDLLSGRARSDLFIRWAQFSALTAFMRQHGGIVNGARMPWTLSPEHQKLWGEAIKLHRQLIPEIRRAWQSGVQTGVPPMRPMWMDEPADPQAGREEAAWMIGENIVASPVMRKNAGYKTTYLPRGCWQLYGQGTTYTGRARVTVNVTLKDIPYFVRCGTTPLAPAAG